MTGDEDSASTTPLDSTRRCRVDRSASTRVYGLRGWTKTCSSSSNQASKADHSKRTVSSRPSTLARREDLGGVGPVDVVRRRGRSAARRPAASPRSCPRRRARPRDVGERDVVLREAGPLPDVAGPGRVDDRPAAQAGPDAAGDGLDVVGRDGRGGIVAHRWPPSVGAGRPTLPGACRPRAGRRAGGAAQVMASIRSSATLAHSAVSASTTIRLRTSPSTRPSSTQARCWGSMRDMVEQGQTSGSRQTTVLSG